MYLIKKKGKLKSNFCTSLVYIYLVNSLILGNLVTVLAISSKSQVMSNMSTLFQCRLVNTYLQPMDTRT